MKDTDHYPPPWSLNGEGFIIPFLANKELVLNNGFIEEKDKPNFLGGIGAVMLVNYESSDVGPYFELLFIPGDFKETLSTNGNKKDKDFQKDHKNLCIKRNIHSRRKVELGDSKGICELFLGKNKNRTSVNISNQSGKIFFKADFTKKFLPFPVTTKLYPISSSKSESGKLC